MLTSEQLEKFLKVQLKEYGNIWRGLLRVSEEELFYAFNIQGIEKIEIVIDEKILTLIPLNNGDFFIKKINHKFSTIELEDLENLTEKNFAVYLHLN